MDTLFQVMMVLGILLLLFATFLAFAGSGFQPLTVAVIGGSFLIGGVLAMKE